MQIWLYNNKLSTLPYYSKQFTILALQLSN
jgi:hypothetical protein